MSIIIEHKDGRKVEIGVMKIYRRERKALVNFTGAESEILAYFTSDETAEKFEAIIHKIVDMMK